MINQNQYSYSSFRLFVSPRTYVMHFDSHTTVEEALAHPYLEKLHDVSDEPTCMEPFSFEFEQHALTEEQMKELIYKEALAFNPQFGF